MVASNSQKQCQSRPPGFTTAARTVVGLVLLAAAAGCSRTPREYVIGAAGPQTMQFGIQTQHGIDLALDEINRAGGIGGVPLRIVVRDDHSTGADAARIAGEFVADRRIIAVIGHPGSAAEVAAAHVYNGGRLAALATTPSSPDLTGVSPWVFRMISSDSVNGVTLARFASALSDSLHRPARVAVLYRNDAYGRGLSDAFLRSFRGQVISSDPIGPDTDLEPYISFYKTAAPDLIFVASEEELGTRVLHQARQQHLSTCFLGGDGWQGIPTDSLTSSVYIGTPFATHSASGAAGRFVATYSARFGKRPDANASLAYDATKLIARAILEVGPDRTKIRGYLASLSRSKPYVSLSGPMWFAANNDPVGNTFVITQARDGSMQQVTGR